MCPAFAPIDAFQDFAQADDRGMRQHQEEHDLEDELEHDSEQLKIADFGGGPRRRPCSSVASRRAPRAALHRGGRGSGARLEPGDFRAG